VLDKAKAHDRADYGRAIAKAASGRALLFASALDRRATLHRRLKSMLSNPTPGRRLTGRAMILATVAVALPLTATRAIDYVDVPTASPTKAASPAATAVTAVTIAQTAAPANRAQPAKPLLIQRDGKFVMINGQEKEWKDLTPAEKAEVRRSIAEAKEELSRVNSEEIQRNVREAMEEARIDQEELRRDLAEARAEIDQAMREVDAHAVEIRRSGQDAEQIKATIRASLKAVEAIDVEAITRNALASVDPAHMQAAMAAAKEGVEKAEEEIERLEERFEQDD
jgi:hypothetical protein